MTELRRDAQQWVYDMAVKETGKVFHFQGDGRGWLPPSVKQHDMISKHLGLLGVRLERLAHEEFEARHHITALELFLEASTVFANAQHTVFETNAEKRLLHAASIRCYDEVRHLSPAPIERLEIPWEGRRIYANLHLLPDRRLAPCVLFMPGCDMTKEMFPHPLANPALQRGLHLVCVDGPGQGECNLDDTKLTADNYERAMSAVIDVLGERSEIGPVGVFGLSFASHWAVRTAAADPRVRACAGLWASLCDKRHLLDVESPRWKRLFAYLTGAETEAELDEIAAAMAVDDLLGGIACPTLLTVGEFDPRSPLAEVVRLYGLMTCERELWVHADQHHNCTVSGRMAMSERSTWNLDAYSLGLDWLRDRLEGRPVRNPGEVTYLEPGGSGPYAARPTLGADWLSAKGLS